MAGWGRVGGEGWGRAGQAGRQVNSLDSFELICLRTQN